jgi:hypothetical protein
VFIALISALFFLGLTWLHLAVGPLEAKRRSGTDRLYPLPARFSRERGELIMAWVTASRRYDGVPPLTLAVLYGMRLVMALLILVFVAALVRLLLH